MSCRCNHLSHECDPITGKCLNCQYNTAGDHCQHCAEGYYGDAAQLTCRLCPCPFSVPSNSFALGCMQMDSGDVQCVCKPGYAGSRCERCLPGYYGNPMAANGKCQPCNCHHGDPNKCHPVTGECENPNGWDDCQECDECVVSLMKDLEGMDTELSHLKTQLEKLNGSSVPLAQLKRLEGDITDTRDLLGRFNASVVSMEPKVKQLESDMRTIREDLVALDNKAKQLLPTSEEVLKNVTHTKHRSQELLNRAEDLLRDIQELLEQIRDGSPSHSSGPVLAEDAARMLQEAKRMVQEMRRQNCSAQSAAASTELQQARDLLDIIRNLTAPANSNQVLADWIGGSLMRDLAALEDLQKALRHAEDLVHRTHRLNNQSQTTLWKLQSRATELTEERDGVTSDQLMAKQLLGNVSNAVAMLQHGKIEYERLAAQLDGAKTDLTKILSSFSSLASAADLVHQAELHAMNLSDLAMAFSMEVQRLVNSSDAWRSIQAARAYSDIIKAIQEAESLAREAKEAADKALEDVTTQDLTSHARSLTRTANSLEPEAKQAEKSLNDTVEELGSQKERIGLAEDKMAALWRDLQASKANLSKINRGETEALLNSSKAAVSLAESKVNGVITRLDEMKEGLRNISVGEDNDLDEVLNQTIHAIRALDQAFPTLVKTLEEVENSSSLAPASGNMSDSMKRIRNLIEQTRQMANMIKVPMRFSGKGYVEPRLPVDLRDLRAVTTFDLRLQRPSEEPRRGDSKRKRRHRQGRGRGRRQNRETAENMFVLYLGNKNAAEDFIGMVLKNSVLYSMYRLGGDFHHKEIRGVTRSSKNQDHFDRLDFRRIYQDLEVIYTERHTGGNPSTLPAVKLQPESRHNLLHLDPNSTVFYVGGFPQSFTPPVEMGLNLSMYHGCVEFSMLNHKLFGLYNFRGVHNVNNQKPCKRQSDAGEQLYFDGTGYAEVNIKNLKRQIQISVKSRLKNALLFYIGNEESYYSLTVEKGYLVLTGCQGGEVFTNRTAQQVFPTDRDTFKSLDFRFITQATLLDPPLTLRYTKANYNKLYIGGAPESIRERDNITAPALIGLMENLPKVDAQRVDFKEILGVMKGFHQDLPPVREAEFKTGSYLTEKPTPFNSMISLGFKTTEPGSVLLQTTQGAQGLELALTDGHVEFKYGSQAVRSSRRYHDGRWHYLTALTNDSGLRLSIDDSDMGGEQSNPSPVVTDGNNLALGREVFTGCLGDLYIRRSVPRFMPADLSQFTQHGDVTLGVCQTERPPKSIKSRQKNNTKKKSTQPKKKHRKKKSGSSPEVQTCKSPVAIPQAFSLNPNSQLIYDILPEELNIRPSFSLVMRTTSAEGLILHINGKRNEVQLALYMTSGKINLAVGKEVIEYHKKINNNEWHKVDFIVEKNSFLLLVDNFRVPDGQLHAVKGDALNLISPVYLGADLSSPRARAQREGLPRASVAGCIYNIKFGRELLEDPLTQIGVSPCFDGKVEPGVFFSGEGAYLTSKKPLKIEAGKFHLTFDIRPQDLMGVLFHARGQGSQRISVHLQNDKIIALANDGGGEYNASIAISPRLCNSFHSVTVDKQNNTVVLGLDSKSRRATGPSPASFSSTLDSLDFGGRGGVSGAKLWRSYRGCLWNAKLNGEDVSLSRYTPHGPVSMQGCPVI